MRSHLAKQPDSKCVKIRSLKIFLKFTLLVNIYLFKVSDRYTRKSCEICSHYQLKHQSDVIDVVLVFLLLTMNR